MAATAAPKLDEDTNKTLHPPSKHPHQSSPSPQPSDPNPADSHPLKSSTATTAGGPEVSTYEIGGDDSKAKSVALTEATGGDSSGTVSDVLKKMRRAERFGVPVQLSEEEKRNSRAERFGTRSSPHGLDASKKSEELKRKARAERFGLTQSVPDDEDAKKKARLARFAPQLKTDSAEEDKRKARAIRFSQSSSGSMSHENGKGNIEPKTAIASKAGGVD